MSTDNNNVEEAGDEVGKASIKQSTLAGGIIITFTINAVLDCWCWSCSCIVVDLDVGVLVDKGDIDGEKHLDEENIDKRMSINLPT
jgi:hypothetical protein